MRFWIVEKVEQMQHEGGETQTGYKLILRAYFWDHPNAGRLAYAVNKEVYDNVRVGETADVEVKFDPTPVKIIKFPSWDTDEDTGT
jgi:hypothetical protein